MTRFASSALCVVLLVTSAGAIAGGSSMDGADEDRDLGAFYFGEAKDLKTLKAIEGVHVSAQRKGAPSPIFASTDPEGRFRIPGFGKAVNSDDVDITCSRAGWQLVNLSRRKVSGAADAPVEIECLLEMK